jgi:hypothetical protein
MAPKPHTSGWLWVENPDFMLRRPELLVADCHDRTPFITIHCACDFDNHVHESSSVEVPPDHGVASKCNGCGELMLFEPGWFQFAFEDLRRRGWLE